MVVIHKTHQKRILSPGGTKLLWLRWPQIRHKRAPFFSFCVSTQRKILGVCVCVLGVKGLCVLTGSTHVTQWQQTVWAIHTNGYVNDNGSHFLTNSVGLLAKQVHKWIHCKVWEDWYVPGHEWVVWHAVSQALHHPVQARNTAVTLISRESCDFLQILARFASACVIAGTSSMQTSRCVYSICTIIYVSFNLTHPMLR